MNLLKTGLQNDPDPEGNNFEGIATILASTEFADTKTKVDADTKTPLNDRI